jgi:extradiol dioxygenase family protein
MPALFHVAYHVLNLDDSRAFYCGALGCSEGRSTSTWVDIDFFGHQLSLHLGQPFAVTNTGRVAEHLVPMPHIGVILPMDEWKALVARLEGRGDIAFDLKPHIRFPGQPGEQATMFFRDPSGNPIEVKGFSDLTDLYAQ